jgi:uncharacterized protein
MWAHDGRNREMSIDHLAEILSRSLENISSKTIDLRFAGGEPLLAGLSWFEKAISRANKIAEQYDKTLTFSLQTNATLVDEQLANFLAGNRFTVGVSIDGPPAINDLTRSDSTKVIRGFKLLTRALGSAPGVIVTVTKCNYSYMPQTMDYLFDNGVKYFRANLMGGSTHYGSHLRPSPEEWNEARMAIISNVCRYKGILLEHNISVLSEKLIRSVLSSVSPLKSGCGCADLRCPAGNELLYFNQTGKAYSCPRSNVIDDSHFASVSNGDFAQKWSQQNDELDEQMTQYNPECKTCPAQVVCDFGCHPFNLANSQYFLSNCLSSKSIWGSIDELLVHFAEIYLYTNWRQQIRLGIPHFSSIDSGLELDPREVQDLSSLIMTRLSSGLTDSILLSKDNSVNSELSNTVMKGCTG